MKKFVLLCATSAFAIPSAAFAQSTGTTEMEKETIVVTGTRAPSVGGVEVPPTTKTREVLNSEFIQRQVPGQSINEVVNQLPGVSFTNNDPFGSAGGSLVIRGFDNSRIAETFDGMPLNDTGNYAIFSNQMLDSELIEQVNVSLGSTDVDSPTAAATGSTVNYRTRRPFQTFGARLEGSYGWFDGGDYFRTFGVIDTGAFGPFGTRAFVSASMATNDNVYGHRGLIYKQQYNAALYQPIGTNGDFITLAVHYNQNRNNFFGSLPLRTDLTQSPTNSAPRVVGSDATNRYPLTRAERDYTVAPCQTNQVARPGVADAANTCGSAFEERLNPSDTGNVRAQSRFTLAKGLVLTIDPSFQWVKANGGGTVVAQEGLRDVNPAGGTASPNACVGAVAPANSSCQIGYLGGTPFFGKDLNGDGDRLDTVRVLAPSQTHTKRIGLNASLRYDITDTQTIRIAASYDRGLHRQTGETGFLEVNGEPFTPFPINNPIVAANGDILEKRDRRSIALLEQIGAEYRGEFFDRRLTINAGVRIPRFTRDLTNNCLTSSASGFVECFGQNTAGLAAYEQFNPTVSVGGVPQAVQGPQHRVLKYNAVLPNIGVLFDVTDHASVFANYSKGLQVPSTDNLYNNFFFAFDNPNARPKPETTDNFDVGARYRSGKLMAQASFWYTIFQNRLASAFDPDLQLTVFRNLGRVDKHGIDASVSYQILPQLQVYVYGSYLWSKIQDNVQISGTAVAADCTGSNPNPTLCALTAGRRESGAPIYTFGGSVQAKLGPVELRVQAKRTGPRYVDDVNLPLIIANRQVYNAKVPAYTLVDVGARMPLGWAGLNDDTYLQFNITNLFDKLYVGNFGGQLVNTTVPFVQLGSPRAFVLTLNVAYR
ncbi:MAG: iron complex outerrane recepter protein [Sphingomonadales bacterium]|jgi:iron complex outermembrane receptor protein|nr:iron complex outerrane recepter protein [Sphingomonadales bacterium]